MIESVIEWIVEFVHGFGYIGIFIMTFLESTFMPIPSEVTMIPAGYLVQQGKMDFWLVWIAATFGTLCGSLANYYLALYLGRPMLLRYGKYFFMNERKLAKVETFIANHGEIAMFTGRLVPGLRHFIAFPAGLVRMRLKPFCIYTTLGGAIWMAVLIGVGYVIGDNKEMVKYYMPYVIGVVLIVALIGIFVYIRLYKRKMLKRTNGQVV